MDDLCYHVHNWRASPNLWSAECKGFLRRQQQTEHETEKLAVHTCHEIIHQLRKTPRQYRESNTEPLVQLANDIITEPQEAGGAPEILYNQIAIIQNAGFFC